jgi:hypothetical protein
MKPTKNDLLEYIKWLEADNASTLAKYGEGVRPSWVSTDLAINDEKIQRSHKLIALIDMESPCDEWSGGYGEGQL